MTRADEVIHQAQGGGPAVTGHRAFQYCLAILSIATAVTHFAVAGGHYRQYWVFGVFMLAAAWLQLLWAIGMVARPSRPLLWAGAILDAGVVAVYIVTRTVGDVIGPAPRQTEPVGFGDTVCTVLEAIVVAGCLWLLFSRAHGRMSRRRLVTALAATGAATAVLLSTSLVAGGPEMVMNASGSTGAAPSPAKMPAGQVPGARVSPVRLATASPAGDITMPDPGMQMPTGMKMASAQACTAAPTKAQQEAAVSLVNTTWKDASTYRSLAAAKAAGYRPVTPAGKPVVHYVDPSSYLATVMGGATLNPAKPQSLVYANTPKGAVLAAVMYIAPPRGATPQPGGCLTQWHVHTNLCLSRGLGVVGVASPACPPGSRNRVTPPMMHVWFVPIPGGPTAIDAPDRQIVRAAEQVSAPANGTA